MNQRKISYAIAVNNRQVFERNFLASPALSVPPEHEILVQQHFASAAKAYNDAIDKCRHDLIVFAHQDIILPESWLSQVTEALDHLDVKDPKWGVLGCYGKSADGKGWGHLYSSGRGVFGGPFKEPVPVQTLDEIVLILRRSSGLRFDERLPHFHLYGSDICLTAAKRGMRSYAISAFCIHNTHQYLVLPKEFYECCRHVKRIWKDALPIQTTCIAISQSGLPIHIRRFREKLLRLRGKTVGALRLDDPLVLLEQFKLPAQEFSVGAGLSMTTRVGLAMRKLVDRGQTSQ